MFRISVTTMHALIHRQIYHLVILIKESRPSSKDVNVKNQHKYIFYVSMLGWLTNIKSELCWTRIIKAFLRRVCGFVHSSDIACYHLNEWRTWVWILFRGIQNVEQNTFSPIVRLPTNQALPKLVYIFNIRLRWPCLLPK